MTDETEEPILYYATYHRDSVEDYCRCCLMDTWDGTSDDTVGTLEYIEEWMAEWLLVEAQRKRDAPMCWTTGQFTLQLYDPDGIDELLNEVRGRAIEKAMSKIAEQETAEAARKEQEQRIKEEANKQARHAAYLALKKEFEEGETP